MNIKHLSVAVVCFCTVGQVCAASPDVWSWKEVAGGRIAAMVVPSAGQAGFTLVDNARAGISFTNALNDQLIMANNNFMEGSGVALGDFDGDGWCDIFFCALAGRNMLFRNLGNWTFEDATARAGVAGGGGWNSTGAVFADIDGDGDLDLLVNTLGQGTHSFLNLGQGRFKETTAEAGLTASTGSLGMALGDVDGDEDLDLYVANYGTLAILRAGGQADLKQVNGKWEVTGPYADRLRYVEGQLEEVGEPDVLYLNDGRGGFKAVPWGGPGFLDEQGKPMVAPWDFGLGVQIRDINEDGYPDIYVCNDFQTVDRLWLNNGQGQFRLAQKLTMRHQSYASMGVDFADLDRDGHLDFFVVEMASRDHARRMTQISGMRPQVPYPGWFETRPEIGRNTLFWNQGDGVYAEIGLFSGLSASEWSWQPVFLDVDLDGYEDVLIANGNAFDVQDRDTLNRVRALGKQTPEQTRTNILLYPRLLTPNAAYRNRGNLTFEDSAQAWGFDSTRISHGVALADLDHDGDLDVVVNCLYTAPLIYRNESSAPRLAVRLRGNASNVQGIGAKIKVLGGPVPIQSQEMVSGGRYLSGDDALRVFAAGHATNVLRVEVVWRNGLHSVLTQGVANSLCEIDEAQAQAAPSEREAPAPPWFSDVSSILGHKHFEEIFDDYSRQPLLPKQLSSLGPGLAWLDLNRDGHDDLAIGSGKGGGVTVFRGDGQGQFKRWADTSTAVAADDVVGLAGWVSAEGRIQLLAGQATYETLATNGSSVMAWSLPPDQEALRSDALPDVPVIGPSTGPLAVADYNGDGQLDVFVGGRVVPGRYPQPASSRLFLQSGGRLVLDTASQGLLNGVGLVSGAVWSDLNGDGLPELVLACEWGPVKVFHNQRGRLRDVTAALGLERLTGWWSGVTAADLDGDGRMDLIAGNWGLNSSERASLEHPARLYYGDLADRGTMDLVEAYFAPELQREVPRRSLGALAQAAPLLGQFYSSHAAFSKVGTQEIFQHLKVMPKVAEATTLASMVFYNRGNRFEPVLLPAQAQWAPVMGVTAADFDGDGNEDLFLSQNFFALRLEVSRQDGGRGLWLRGNGNQILEPVPGHLSGLTIYGEQRGAAAGDFNEDGRVDLVVAQNGAETKLYRNEKARPGLRVRLQGPPGNPDGIGALVRPMYGEHLGPAKEIHSGSGYWSQDSPVLVVGGSSPPTAIVVRWPGGVISTNGVPPDARQLNVQWK